MIIQNDRQNPISLIIHSQSVVFVDQDLALWPWMIPRIPIHHYDQRQETGATELNLFIDGHLTGSTFLQSIGYVPKAWNNFRKFIQPFVFIIIYIYISIGRQYINSTIYRDRDIRILNISTYWVDEHCCREAMQELWPQLAWPLLEQCPKAL